MEHSDWLMPGTRILSGFLLRSFSTRFYVKGSRVYAALDHVHHVIHHPPPTTHLICVRYEHCFNPPTETAVACCTKHTSGAESFTPRSSSPGYRDVVEVILCFSRDPAGTRIALLEPRKNPIASKTQKREQRNSQRATVA